MYKILPLMLFHNSLHCIPAFVIHIKSKYLFLTVKVSTLTVLVKQTDLGKIFDDDLYGSNLINYELHISFISYIRMCATRG